MPTSSPTALCAAAIAAMTACGGCTGNTAFDGFRAVGDWHREDTVAFCVPATARGGSYDEEVWLRFDGSYPFAAVTVIVEQRITPTATPAAGTTTTVDTLRCPLFGDDGKPRGSGIMVYQETFPLRTVTLAEGDSLTVDIRHDMRRSPLTGISDVGFRLVAR